jgi:branched-chain amino acid transport system substrate-binding protein
VPHHSSSGPSARFTAIAALAGALAAFATPAAAQVLDDVVKLAITNDQSSIYSAAGGYGVVIAAQMAVEDFGGTVLGKKIEVVFADNQNKPDVGVGIVNRWLDTDHVDVIVDGGSSAVGMAVQAVTREKNKLFLITGSGTTALTNDNCSPVGFQWSWDTYGLASGTATTLAKQGLDSWFFITADYTFGQVLEAQAGEIAQKYGAKVLGSVRAPFNTADFSSFLLQAKASNAKVVALANAGGDASTSIKQAHEFGLTRGGQKLAALFLNITDVHALGLDTAQGLVITTSFYWDRTHASRAFGKRFLDRAKNAPTFLQAGAYSAVTHYLKAVKEAGTDATGPVAAQMKKMKINDPMTENGWIREDGRVMRDFYVVQVKTPAESKAPWDYYTVVGKVAAEDAALPLSRSTCKLVQK